MKKKSKIIVVLILLIIGILSLYNYIYQNHRNIQKEPVEVSVSSSDLVGFFNKNESEKILNKTVEIFGKITEINSKSLTIDNKVQCSFEIEVNAFKLNQIVTIKGRCIGFDELFGLVKIDQSSIIK